MARSDIKNSSLLKTKFLIYAFYGRTEFPVPHKGIWTAGNKSKPNGKWIMWWMGITAISKRGGFSVKEDKQ